MEKTPKRTEREDEKSTGKYTRKKMKGIYNPKPCSVNEETGSHLREGRTMMQKKG